MDVGRLRKGEWLLAVAAVGLLAVMFAPWYAGIGPAYFGGGGAPPSEPQLTAWRAHAAVDILLTAYAAMALGAVALAAGRRAPAAPVAAAVVTAGIGILLAVFLLVRILFPPGPNALVEPRWGAWVGLLCVVGIAAGAWIAMADERTDALEPSLVPAQPTPPEVAPAGSVVAEGRAPGADDDRD